MNKSLTSHIIPTLFAQPFILVIYTANNDHKRTFNIEIKYNDVLYIKLGARRESEWGRISSKSFKLFSTHFEGGVFGGDVFNI